MIKLSAVLVVLSVGLAAPAIASPPVGGYASCAQAAKDGASNIPQGAAGYNSDLDRDGDGIACESKS